MCALVALAFTSCKKNQSNGTLTFEASITQPQSNDRTWVTARNNLAWSMGDTILVFDANAAHNEFTVDKLSGTGSDLKQHATFVVEDAKKDFMNAIATPKSYSAFYPHASFDDVNNKVSMTIPSTQYYDFDPSDGGHFGSFVTNTYPMFGVNDAAYHFQFHSHAGILEFQFGCEENRIVRVSRILVTSDDPLVGTMVYDYKYPVDSVYRPTDDVYTVNSTATRVELMCSNDTLSYYELPQPVGGINYQRFDIALLRGALANGFHVTVYGYKNDPVSFGPVGSEEIILLDREVPASIDNINVNNTIEAEKITSMMRLILPAYGPGEGDGTPHNN